jgi:Flp pilus assembly protein CpaB
MLRAAVIAAVAAAIIAVFMGVMYLRFSGDSRERILLGRRDPPVVVAAQDIPAGTTVTEEMVEVGYVPEDDGAYSDTASVVGQVTKVAVAEGDQVTASKILSSGPPA